MSEGGGMKKILITVFCVLGFKSAFAIFFGLNNYVIEKNNISKYPNGIYGVFIDYDLSGAVKQSLSNRCIIEKDSTSMVSPECMRNGKGDFRTSYLKMKNLINVAKGTSCVLNIMFYDKSDLLIQNRELAAYNDCQWVPIPKDTSIDVARKYIVKIEGINVLNIESTSLESKTRINPDSRVIQSNVLPKIESKLSES